MLPKHSESWNLDIIKNIVSGSYPEGEELEFKESIADDSSKNNFCKTVSAYANSTGGFIIIGLKDEKHVENSVSFEQRACPICKTDDEIHQQIGSVLNSSIQPKLNLDQYWIKSIKAESEGIFVVVFIKSCKDSLRMSGLNP